MSGCQEKGFFIKQWHWSCYQYMYNKSNVYVSITWFSSQARKKKENVKEMCIIRTRKGDLLIEVIAWSGVTVFSVFLVSTTFSLFLGGWICSLIKMISCSVKPYFSNSSFRLLLVNIWSNIITDASSCWNIITVVYFVNSRSITSLVLRGGFLWNASSLRYKMISKDSVYIWFHIYLFLLASQYEFSSSYGNFKRQYYYFQIYYR